MQNIELVHGMQNHCNCPIESTLNVIGGKWKPMILCLLANDTLRYNKIQQLIPEVSPKMLTKQLRELEYDGLILRKMYPETPPKGRIFHNRFWKDRASGIKNTAGMGSRIYG